ncbi:MAG TPA: AsmA family protein, partial [Hyphomicrobiaceae bacterium]|nr:AsmA family protein [Hyphomicrobiaceae bacterium]
MNNILMYLGGLVVLVLGALFAVPLFVDWNSYRGAFEEEASRLIGREVRVGGRVSLRLLPTPTVRLEKVRIADSSGQTGEPFFRADTFTLYLAIAPLVQGTIEANDIELTRPVLHLAVDESGQGNWRAIKRSEGRAGFSAQDIALPSVKVVDGTIALHGLKGEERLRFEKVTGEVGTPALEGPYRVRLTFNHGGVERELRMSTSRPETDGSVRLKANLRETGTPTSYLVDGKLKDFLGATTVDGEISAKLPLGGPARRAAGKSEADDLVDLKSTFKANASEFSLDDLAMSFESGGRPQLVSGTIKGQWREALSLDATLGSRWLDLDRLGGTEKAEIGPLARSLGNRMAALFPSAARASLRVAVDQATINGDILSQIIIALDRTATAVTVRELRATMPGGSRLDLRGVAGLDGSKPARFDGEVTVRGSSISRMLAWSLGKSAPALRRDSAFGLRGKLSIESGLVLVNDMMAELAG